MQHTGKEKPLAYFKEHLEYRRDTGTFLWRKTRGKGLAGQIAGAPHCMGYIQIGLSGYVYLAHRLVCLFETGEWPSGVIDHINRDKTDNRFSNLRDCSQCENLHNSGIRPDNTSGARGVSLSRRHGKYLSYINYQGKRHNCGLYETVAAASAAREVVKTQLGL